MRASRPNGSGRRVRVLLLPSLWLRPRVALPPQGCGGLVYWLGDTAGLSLAGRRFRSCRWLIAFAPPALLWSCGLALLSPRRRLAQRRT